MEKNEGKTDRVIRLVIGLLALYASWMYNVWWLVLAIPALVTAITGFCLPYKLLGINTAKKPVVKNIKVKKKVKK
jgi:hypothetical protein